MIPYLANSHFSIFLILFLTFFLFLIPIPIIDQSSFLVAPVHCLVSLRSRTILSFSSLSCLRFCPRYVPSYPVVFQYSIFPVLFSSKADCIIVFQYFIYSSVCFDILSIPVLIPIPIVSLIIPSFHFKLSIFPLSFKSISSLSLAFEVLGGYSSFPFLKSSFVTSRQARGPSRIGKVEAKFCIFLLPGGNTVAEPVFLLTRSGSFHSVLTVRPIPLRQRHPTHFWQTVFFDPPQL